MVGMAHEERKLRAAAPVEPHREHPDYGRVHRPDTPGTSARIWQDRCERGRAACARHHTTGRGSQGRSTSSMPCAAMNAAGKHARALVENRLNVVGEKRAGDKRRDRRDDDGRGEMSRIRTGPEIPDHVDDFFTIQPDDGEDGSKLDHDGEDATRIVVADRITDKQKVCGRRKGRNSVIPARLRAAPRLRASQRARERNTSREPCLRLRFASVCLGNGPASAEREPARPTAYGCDVARTGDEPARIGLRGGDGQGIVNAKNALSTSPLNRESADG